MLDQIPAELRALRQWVVWRLEDRGGEKPTKIPYDPNTGSLAEVNNVATWGTFEAACFASQNYNGLGFVLTADDPYTFIDLDTPKDATLGEVQPRIVEQFQTYAELSPSGVGLHLICRGKVPSGKKNSKAGVEVYSELRYMTMTGNVWRNAPIVDCQALLDVLWHEMGGSVAKLETVADRPQLESDQAVIDTAKGAKNGDRFQRLWEGHWQGAFPSQSEADQALMNMLAFYTQSHDQLARLFRMSALGQREKANRDDYVRYGKHSLIAKALDREVPMLDFSAFDAWVRSEIDRIAAEAAAREAKRIEGIERAIQAKHEAAQQVAVQTFEDRHNGSPYQFAPIIAQGEDFPPPPGLLGQIAAFIYAQSPYPLPRTALAGAIAFLSGLCGRAYNINGLGVNTYTLLVAPTGVGKEAMASGISKLSLAAREIVPGISSYFGVDQIASGQALYGVIKERKACLSLQTEFGLELQNLTNPRAPSPVKLLKKAYLELFTKSGEGQILGASVFADKIKNTDALKSPGFSLLAETAPPHLYDALNETMLADGLLPRFMLIEVDNGSDVFNSWSHTTQPTRELIEQVATLAAAALKMDHNDRAIQIALDEEAQQLSESYRAVTKRTVDLETKESGRQMWSRCHVKALKLAGIVALGCNPYSPQVSADMLRWAICIVNDGTKRLITRFERGDLGEGDARQTADVKKFLFRYCKEDEVTLPSHAFNKDWHTKRIIGYSYIRQNVIQMASFRNGVGGSSQSFLRCLKSLCDEGLLFEIPTEQLQRYGTVGKLYAIVNAALL